MFYFEPWILLTGSLVINLGGGLISWFVLLSVSMSMNIAKIACFFMNQKKR